jgi:hypothetical protein
MYSSVPNLIDKHLLDSILVTKKNKENTEAMTAKVKKYLLRVTSVSSEMWFFLQEYADNKGLSTRSAAARFILNAAMREWNNHKNNTRQGE